MSRQSDDERSRARFAAVARAARRSQRFGLAIVVFLAVVVAVVSSAVSAWNTTELRRLTRDCPEVIGQERK